MGSDDWVAEDPEAHLLPHLEAACEELPLELRSTRSRDDGTFEVDLTWDKGRLTKTVIHSRLGNPCVVSYNGREINLKTAPGQTYEAIGDIPWADFPAAVR